MEMDERDRKDVVNRLRRARGQIDGVLAMLEQDKSCREVVTQLAAATKALDKAGFKIVSLGLTQCLIGEANGEPNEDQMTTEELQKLFMSLA